MTGSLREAAGIRDLTCKQGAPSARSRAGGLPEKEAVDLIELTKLNGETILINALQIEMVESIPESKITMMNGIFHIVTEDKDEVRRKAVEFIRTSFATNRAEA